MNFWEERWSLGQTGWHNPEVNENLIEHHTFLFPHPSPTVLVPLCGKTLDMQWLSEQGAQIIGVDLVQQALDEYVSTQTEPVPSTSFAGFSGYTLPKQTLICANIFDVTPETIGTVDCVFDRAALVALHPSERQKYADHCFNLLKENGRILLITYDSPVEDLQGPPYPVRKGTIEVLYKAASRCTQVAEIVMTPETDPRLKMRGLSWSRTDIWEITK